MSKHNLAQTRYLSEQKQAVLDYLDALLQEIPDEEPDAEGQRAAESVDAQAPSAQDLEPATVTRLRDTPEPSAEPEPAPFSTEETTLDEAFPASAQEPEETAAEARQAANVPEWAEPDFQALIFQVGGLKLAVPLVKLHSVVPWADQVTPMPNQPAWCHGLFTYRGHNVRVVDTATLVLPPEKRHLDDADAPSKILVVGDGRWALSCSRVGEVVRLTPGEVKWRTAKGQRPWLAGTVRERLCAVMDTEAFAAMLDHA